MEHKSNLCDTRLIIKKVQAATRVRTFYILGGVAEGLRTLKVNNASIDTLSAALLERMFYCQVGGVFVAPPSVDRRHLHLTLKTFRNLLLRNVGCIGSKLIPIEFVSLFRGRKAAIYANVLDDYELGGVSRVHSVSAAFVKCEKVNPSKAPRCIQPRHPIYNMGLGCYLKHIEHRLYKGIARVFREGVVVIKGYDVQEIGHIMHSKWSSLHDPIGIGLDAVKFDMHVSAEMLEWEHSIYLALYRHDPELKRLLGWQVKNRGVGYCYDGKLRYSVDGRRFSGDMNTALGNCIIMCAMVYSYAASVGVSIKLANNGDDCMVFMERHDETAFRQGLAEWFYKCGFRMTVEDSVDRLEQVEFCQMRPINTINGWTMVRNFNTAREKDSICLLPLSNERAFRKWLYAIGECGLALCSGVPVMQALYSCYLRNGLPSNSANSVQMQSGMMMLRRTLDSKTADITDDARAGFMLAWNVTPDEQVCLEEYYSGLVLHYSEDTSDNFLTITSSPL